MVPLFGYRQVPVVVPVQVTGRLVEATTQAVPLKYRWSLERWMITLTVFESFSRRPHVPPNEDTVTLFRIGTGVACVHWVTFPPLIWVTFTIGGVMSVRVTVRIADVTVLPAR